MIQRIPENFSTLDWSLVTIMGNTIPPRDPNDDDEEEEDEDTEPDDEREPAVVREPTKTTKREGSRSSPPALISARLDDRSRTSSGVDGTRVGAAADRQAQIPKIGRRR